MSTSPINCLIATRNNEKTLERCLNSILGQTFSRFKVLIYDDASTDRTPEIIDEFCSADSRVNGFYAKESLGEAHAYNTLIKKSKSKYVAFQRPQDTSSQKRFEVQLERIKNSSLVCVGSSVEWDTRFFDDKKQDLLFSENPTDFLFKQMASEHFQGMFFETGLFLSKALKSVKPFDESMEIHYDIGTLFELQYRFPIRLACVKPVLYQICLNEQHPYYLEHQKKLQVDLQPTLKRHAFQLFYIRETYYHNLLVSKGFAPY